MQVTLFQPNSSGSCSIQRSTKNIASHLKGDLHVKIVSPRYPNKGVFNRLRSALAAVSEQGDVNHITGDVHFLSYFLNKKKTINTIQDCERFTSGDFGFIKKVFFRLFWFTIPYLKSSYITTVSEESKRNIVHYGGIPEKDIRVIYNGVDDKFRVIDMSMQEKNSLLQNEQNKKTILHISGITKNKNTSRLIQAIKGINVKFIKVGMLSKEDTVFLDQHKIEYLQFKNIDTDLLVKIYNAVDCLVFPSLAEGFGLPVIEAQACGCPVVTSNISSLPEIAGEGAVFVDPYSIESIQGGIIKILNDDDLRCKTINSGLINVKRFSWDFVTKQYYELYLKLFLKNQ